MIFSFLFALVLSNAQAQRSFPECKVDQKAAEAALSKIQSKYPDVNPSCFQEAQRLVKECLERLGDDDDCGGDMSRLGEAGSLSQASDVSIRGLLKGHNCEKVKEVCFKQKDDAFLLNSKQCAGQADANSGLAEPIAALEVSNVLSDANKCHHKMAKNYKLQAEDTLSQSMAARSDGVAPKIECKGIGQNDRAEKCLLIGAVGGDEMQCMTPDDPGKKAICRKAVEGQEFTQLDENNPEQMKELPHSAGEMKMKGSHCSGGVLGDGTTWITGGHCTEAQGTNQFETRIVDANGQMQTRTVICGAGINQLYQDANGCQLNDPIQAKPAYLMVRDESVSTCTKSGWQLRCPSSAMGEISNQPVTLYSYPGSYGLSKSTGYVRYNESNHTFSHDMATTGGSSGGNVTIDYRGDTVIIGPAVDGSREDFNGKIYSIGSGDLEYMRLQSVSSEELNASAPLFRELDLIQATE